tara:strand:- start:14502 stop:15041 length:540 start_codon:yes stop_codon:yes gene_type:complete
MPKKLSSDIIEVEPEPEPEIKISKRTGKPVRPLTEAQKVNLAKGREKAIATRKALIEGIDLEKRAENIKKAKEEVHRAKIESQKKKYEEAVNDFNEETESAPKPKAEKKIKKKVIKYVEESSSDSEEEEVIIRKKKKDKPASPAPEPPIPEQVSRDNLRKKLQDEQSASMAKLMMPSYF